MAAGATPPSPAAIVVAAEVAPQGRLAVRSTGLSRPVRIQVRRGASWVRIGDPIEKVGGSAVFRAQRSLGRMRLRGVGADGRATASAYVRVRALTLAAVGDINLGDGPGGMIDRFGASYPWAGVGPSLKAADIAFGNLECPVSTRGVAQVKQYTFRGRPSSVPALRTVAGFDVLNLANNHSGDYGKAALLDTLRTLRANAIAPVGAGANERAAYRPVVVERLGLRVAFVGFSQILPYEFRAVGASPGTAWATPERVRASVAAARRDADVVIATFHWGIERETTEEPRQTAMAKLALEAGATAVIGAHPHVLQPIRRPAGGRLIAYSLGNFVFGAGSPGTSRTGILRISLGRDRVLGAKLLPAHISGARPILG